MNKLGRVSEVTKAFQWAADNIDGKSIEIESGLLIKNGILTPGKYL